MVAAAAREKPIVERRGEVARRNAVENSLTMG